MLVGIVNEKSIPSYDPLPSRTHLDEKEIAIIGGGIATACLCYSLVKLSYNVTLYCQNESLACGASGNQQGALSPLLTEDHNSLSQLFANGFVYAQNLSKAINQRAPFEHDFSGLLQLYYDAPSSKKLDKIKKALLPDEMVTKVTAEQSDQLAGIYIGIRSPFLSASRLVKPTQSGKGYF